MTDFRAETRLRHSPYNQSYTNSAEFVAEVRPRRTNIFELRHPNSLYLSHGLSGRPSLAPSNDFVVEIRSREINNSEFGSENRQNMSQDVRNESLNPSNDFVAEVRRKQTNVSEFSSENRQNLSQEVRNQSLNQSKDFVAEIRPRQTNHSEFRCGNSQCLSDEVSDQDLMDILSGEHFSREDIIRILRGSILTLVEKLLTGRSLARIDGSLSVYVSSDNSPFVVNITQNYFTSLKSYHQTDQSLEDCLNIKIRHENIGASINNHTPSLTKSPQSNKEVFNTMNETCPKSNMILTKSPLFESYKDESTNMDDKCAKSTMSSEVSNDLLVENGLQNYKPNSVNEFSFQREIQAQSDENEFDYVSETNCDSSDESDDESGYSSTYKSDSDASSEDGCTLPHKLEMYNEYYCSGLDEKNTMCIPFDYGPTLTKASEKQEYTGGVLCDVSNDVRSGDDVDDDDDEFKHKLVIDESSSSELTESCSGISTSSNVEVSKSFEQSIDVEMEEITSARGIRMDCKQDLFSFDNHTRRDMEDMMDETDYPPSCEETDFANGWEDTDFPSSSDITDTDTPVGFHGDGCCSTRLATASFPHKKLRLMKGPEPNLESHKNQETCAGRNPPQNDLHNCIICCKTFTAKNSLKKHMRMHAGQRPYKCTHCTQSFSRRDDFKDHQARHEYANPFRCSKCAKGFTDREYLKNHMDKEHGSRIIHVCSQCGESYDEEEAFATHRRTHPELLQFACTTCSFIGTNNQMIQKHFLLHAHKLFSCKPCNAYFADPFDYTNHIRTHKKSPTFSRYSCCFCDVTLPTYYQYKRHEHSHTQGKTHSCKMCKKIFKSKSLLQDHTTAIHQEHFKDQAPQSPIHAQDLNQSTSMCWQANETQTNVLSGPIPESRHHPMETLPLQPPLQMQTSSSCEGICDEYDGELLDLSMKKMENLNVSSPKEEKKVLVYCDRELEFGPSYFPRNGDVVSELCTSDNGINVKAHAHLASSTAKLEIRHDERKKSEVDFVDSSIKREWNSPSSQIRSLSPCSLSSGSSDAGNCLFLKPIFSTRLRNDEWGVDVENSPNFDHSRGALDQNTFKECAFKSPIRFNPYSREKFADLAAKFLAARGPKFLQSRLPLSVNTSNWETRQDTARSSRGYLQTEQTCDLNPLRFKVSPSLDGINGFNDNQMFFPKPPLPSMDIAARGDVKIGHKSGRNGSNPETALVNRSQCLVQPDLQLGTGHGTKDVIKKEVRISNGGRVTNTSINDINKNNKYIVESSVLKKQSSVVNMADSSTHGSFECEDCKEMFSTFSDLENHSVDVHKRYLCEHCKKSFTARPNRDRHVRYHTGERPYKCDLCELAFFRGDDLKYHRTTRHHTAQPFVCGSCDASFSWKRDLDRHIRHSKCKT